MASYPERFYSYSPVDGFTTHESAYDAADSAHRELEECREIASKDLWPNNVEDIEWGLLVPIEKTEQYDHDVHDDITDYQLDRPASDTLVRIHTLNDIVSVYENVSLSQEKKVKCIFAALDRFRETCRFNQLPLSRTDLEHW